MKIVNCPDEVGIGGGMFGIGNDQNQNSAPPAQPVQPVNMPNQNPAMPSAPMLNDPVIPSPAPVAPVPSAANDVKMENGYIAPAPQIGPAKTTQPDSVPTAASMINNSSAPPATKDDELTQIKQQALTSLEPIVGHLDQEPEEKFKTLMMLIQASDNSGFLKEAHEAASKIKDEKVRAQALLDVVNEVNYFAHKQAKGY